MRHFTSGANCGFLCVVEWSSAVQGLNNLVQKYQNSTVMHESVAETHKPVILCEGKAVEFPCPTEEISAPPCVTRRTLRKKPMPANKKSQVTTLTTIVLRKLSKQMCRDDLQSVLDTGFAGSYDFLYLPMDFARQQCFGFAIINFCSGAQAQAAMAHFRALDILGECVTVEWSDSQQGLAALVEKYRNSKIMNADVPEAYKPLLFAGGKPFPFPQPDHSS